MSERLLKEFRSRAEDLVPVPDFDELERRGMRRRRAHRTVGAAVIVSALAVGGILATTAIDRPLVGPAQIDPSPSPPTADDTELRFLRSGSSQVVRPFDTGQDPVRPENPQVRFVVPGSSWYWLELGAGTDRNWAHVVGGLNMAEQTGGPIGSTYIRVGVTPIAGVPQQRCPGLAPLPVQAVPESALPAARALVVSPGVEVLSAPSVVQKFGYEAAHVRFRVTQRCVGGQPVVLWRALEAGGDIHGLSGEDGLEPEPRRHIFDVWVVDVRGELLAVFAAHAVGADAHAIAEMRELLDSIRFRFTR